MINSSSGLAKKFGLTGVIFASLLISSTAFAQYSAPVPTAPYPVDPYPSNPQPVPFPNNPQPIPFPNNPQPIPLPFPVNPQPNPFPFPNNPQPIPYPNAPVPYDASFQFKSEIQQLLNRYSRENLTPETRTLLNDIQQRVFQSGGSGGIDNRTVVRITNEGPGSLYLSTVNSGFNQEIGFLQPGENREYSITGGAIDVRAIGDDTNIVFDHVQGLAKFWDQDTREFYFIRANAPRPKKFNLGENQSGFRLERN